MITTARLKIYSRGGYQVAIPYLQWMCVTPLGCCHVDAENPQAFAEGRKAARNNEHRAAPSHYKILTQKWRDWYKGYDSTGLIVNRPAGQI